jgi:hypothetical protein
LRLVLALVLCASSALAAGKAKPKPVPSPAPAPTSAPRAAENPNEPTAALLARVATLYKQLEYGDLIPLAERLLAREDLTLEQKLEGYRLYASAIAIAKDPIDAEKPFRKLLRARPDYDLPKDTPPKIMGVFRKVQAEEKALAAELAEVERTRIIDSLKLQGELPTAAKGGKPLKFSFFVKDPTGAVDSVRLPYRRGGQPGFSSLALSRGDAGAWQGTIPGEFTSDEKGFTLEYYVETLDTKGPLLTVGTDKQPRQVAISPGLFTTTRPPPLSKAPWFVGLAMSLGLGGASTGVGIAYLNSQAEYTRKANSGELVPGSELNDIKARGNREGAAATGLLISTGVAVVTTAVLTPFVNWAGTEAQ